MTTIALPEYSYVKIYKLEKQEITNIDFALCNQPSETLESYYKRQSTKPDIIINGGLFTMSTGKTEFTFVDEGKTINVTPDTVYGFGIKNDKLVYGTYVEGYYKDFVSGYPVLINNFTRTNTNLGKELDYNARRTVLGYDDNYIYIILVDSPGLTFNKIRDICEKLKVRYAINLDGGGSTRMLLNGKRITNQEYSRPVDNVVCFYLKPVQKTIYRVQTGAFSKKEYAEAFKEKIQALDDTIGANYKGAYVRLIDGLYKVQVGAFSVQKNAETVLNDLKWKGINAFITTQ